MSERLAVNELGDLVNGLRSTAARIQEANTRLEKETAVRKAALTRQGDAELEKLLGNPEYKTNAVEAGRKVKSENGTKTACDAIEAMLK